VTPTSLTQRHPKLKQTGGRECLHSDVYAEAFAKYVSPALFRIEAGTMARPDGPGLGLEVDEDAVVNADAHSWEPRRLRSTDGAFLEW